jgi:hypothetical protein
MVDVFASFKNRVGKQRNVASNIPLFGWGHSSAPAYASVAPPRAAAVKNGRFSSGHPEGLFLTAASMAAF